MNDNKGIQYKEAASKIVKVMQFVLPLNWDLSDQSLSSLERQTRQWREREL